MTFYLFIIIFKKRRRRMDSICHTQIEFINFKNYYFIPLKSQIKCFIYHNSIKFTTLTCIGVVESVGFQQT